MWYGTISRKIYAQFSNRLGAIEKPHPQKNVPWVWSKDCDNSVLTIKRKISTPPLLVYLDETKSLMLQVDSSRGGVEDTRLEAKAKDTKKIRGQPFRGQTLSRPRTKDTSASALRKKKVFSKIFQAISTKKRFPKIFQALHKILTIQKIVLSSSRG